MGRALIRGMLNSARGISDKRDETIMVRGRFRG